jgi:hypothetical protein
MMGLRKKEANGNGAVSNRVRHDSCRVGQGEASVSAIREHVPSRRPTRRCHPQRAGRIRQGTSQMLVFDAGGRILVGHRLGQDFPNTSLFARRAHPTKLLGQLACEESLCDPLRLCELCV